MTPLTTWAIATTVLSLLSDPSDISTFYFFFLLVVPAVSIPFAAVVATRLVPTRGRFVSALALAVVGWVVGLVVALATFDANTAELPRYFWDYASALALPAVYGACGAVVAAGLGRG